MVCSSYIVKHLLKPPLQGVCVSAFACVWHLHGHYCSPSIWIEPTARWRFTTSYERAQWPDICLCRSAGQRDGPQGQRGPQVDFREREQQLAAAPGLYRARARLQRGGVLPVRHRREPKRHTSIQDPPSGSIKSSLHREAAPSLLNVR